MDFRANNSTHKTDPQTCVLEPGQQCTVTVNEYYTPPAVLSPGSTPATQVTTASGKTFTITPSSSILTLSGGFMGTTLAARTYTSTNVPGQMSPVLVVNNNSRIRPGAVALLNYAIPHADSPTIGLALSAGPVITFGGAAPTYRLWVSSPASRRICGIGCTLRPAFISGSSRIFQPASHPVHPFRPP